MPIEQGAVNAVFFQHKLQFLTQGLVNLSGGPKPAAFSKAWCEVNTANGLKQRQNGSTKMRRMNYLTIRPFVVHFNDVPLFSEWL